MQNHYINEYKLIGYFCIFVLYNYNYFSKLSCKLHYLLINFHRKLKFRWKIIFKLSIYNHLCIDFSTLVKLKFIIKLLIFKFLSSSIKKSNKLSIFLG